MGEKIQLRAQDGFTLGAYRALPDKQGPDKKGSDKPAGGIVVIQEIFGVNSHIRNVTDGYARAGYVAIAPQIFDRVERNVELGYEADDMTRGVGIARGKLKIEQALADISAAVDDVARYGKVGVVGYCFGGLLAWLTACEVPGVAAVSSYYGGGVAGALDRKPKCPVMMHFGERDAHIPLSDVDKVRAAQPAVTVHVYAADHGFNCDHRGSYDAKAAKVALDRTLEFFKRHVG